MYDAYGILPIEDEQGMHLVLLILRQHAFDRIVYIQNLLGYFDQATAWYFAPVGSIVELGGIIKRHQCCGIIERYRIEIVFSNHTYWFIRNIHNHHWLAPHAYFMSCLTQGVAS